MDISIEQYIFNSNQNLTEEEYLKFEIIRKGTAWANIISKQSFKCYYCDTDIRSIQKLILNRVIGLRRRGRNGFSGLHLELDHKNADNKDNNSDNLVAACYYCNNDKSNTISDKIFKDFFGPMRGLAFDKLLKENKIVLDDFFRHHKYGESILD
jgi:hypothetical protein